MSASRIEAGEAVVRGSYDGSRLEKGLRRQEQKLKAVAKSIGGIGRKMLAVSAPVALAFAPTIKAASDLEETMNKFNVVFGKNAKAVKAWGDDFAAQIGRSKRQVADFLAGSQDLFVPLGFEDDAATNMSKQVTQLAVDLASFNNLADDAVLRDLHAALTGSGEVMKKYGVLVSEAAVKQELLNQGMDPRHVTDQQKVMARLSIIMRGTTAAQGDAERSAGSFANQMKALKAEIENASASIGQALLPAVTAVVKSVAGAVASLESWAKENRELIVTIAKITAVALAVGGTLTVLGKIVASSATAFSAISTAISLASKAVALLGVAFAANPIGATLLAIAAAAGIAATAYEYFRSKANSKLNTETSLKSAARELDRLSRKSELTRGEFQTAQKMIARLESEFGPLGVSVDEVAGKFDGLAEAVRRANSAMAEKNAAAREARATELEGRIAAFDRRISDKRARGYHEAPASDIYRQMYEADVKRRNEFFEELRGLRSSGTAINAISDGAGSVNRGLGGLLQRGGGLLGVGIGKVNAFAEKAERIKKDIGEKRSEETQRLDDELARAKIEATKEGLAKELALIELRKRLEMRRLSELGVLDEKMRGQVEEFYRLQADTARRADEGVADAGRRIDRGSLAGTFSGAVASQLFAPGQGIARQHLAVGKQQLEASKETNRILDRKDGGIVLV